MATDWYYRVGDEIYGPLSPAALKEKAQAGEVVPTTEVRQGVDGRWAAAERVKGLFDLDPVLADVLGVNPGGAKPVAESAVRAAPPPPPEMVERARAAELKSGRVTAPQQRGTPISADERLARLERANFWWKLALLGLAAIVVVMEGGRWLTAGAANYPETADVRAMQDVRDDQKRASSQPEPRTDAPAVKTDGDGVHDSLRVKNLEIVGADGKIGIRMNGHSLVVRRSESEYVVIHGSGRMNVVGVDRGGKTAAVLVSADVEGARVMMAAGDEKAPVRLRLSADTEAALIKAVAGREENNPVLAALLAHRKLGASLTTEGIDRNGDTATTMLTAGSVGSYLSADGPHATTRVIANGVEITRKSDELERRRADASKRLKAEPNDESVKKEYEEAHAPVVSVGAAEGGGGILNVYNARQKQVVSIQATKANNGAVFLSDFDGNAVESVPKLSGAPKRPGMEPYVPTKLQWLALELNAEHHKHLLPGSPYLRFQPDPKDDAIVIYVGHVAGTPRKQIDETVRYARQVIKIATQGDGWDWLRIKEQIESSADLE